MANEKKHEMPMVTIPVWEYADLIKRDALLSTIETYLEAEGYHTVESIEMMLNTRKGVQDGNTL